MVSIYRLQTEARAPLFRTGFLTFSRSWAAEYRGGRRKGTVGRQESGPPGTLGQAEGTPPGTDKWPDGKGRASAAASAGKIN